MPKMTKAQSFQPGTFNAREFVPSQTNFTPQIQVKVPESMPEVKMNFKASARRANFGHQQTFDSPPVDDLKRR